MNAKHTPQQRVKQNRCWLKQRSIRIACVCLAVLLHAPVVWAALPISLNGGFDDWVGQTGINDPVGDATGPHTDLTGFHFGTNPDDPSAYFMAQRVNANKPLDLVLHIDTDDNGVYNDAVDRYITVRYIPQGSKSAVTVELYNGIDQLISTIANNVDWGESVGEGGSRVEFGVSFSDLGIFPGQAMRMYLESQQGGNTADLMDEVQWSPANALGWALAVLILVGGALWMGIHRVRRRVE